MKIGRKQLDPRNVMVVDYGEERVDSSGSSRCRRSVTYLAITDVRR